MAQEIKIKFCPQCIQDKATDDFHKDSQKSDGFCSYCKLCVKSRRASWYQLNREARVAAVQEWRDENRELFQANSKAYRAANKYAIRDQKLRSMYGITLVYWNALFLKQGERCAICKSFHPGPKGWQTDHCHSTGNVRGILCVSCNLGLGVFKDNSSSLREAANYLEG